MASETTPLLPAANDVQSAFPPISSAAQRLPLDPSLFDFQNAYPHPLGRAQPLRAVAFRLLLVLHLLVCEKIEPPLSKQRSTIQAFQELHEQGRRRENLRRLASAILGYVPVAITDARLPGVTETVSEDVAVEHILFTSFSVDSVSFQKLRVIDLLVHPAIPTTILSDPIISLSLVRLWKFGRACLEPLPSDSSLGQRFLTIYDAASTPRTVHTVHLTSHLAYLVLLAHLVLYPPLPPVLINTPGGPVGVREPIIAIYSISNIIFNPWSSSALTHILVLLSFLYSLPASPAPDTIAYSILLLTLCLHILFLHFPRYPTLLLLFEPAQWLPSVSLYVACFKQSLLPSLVLLLPVLVSSTVLLSLSLSDDTISSMQATAFALAAPPAARLAFLGLFTIACLLFVHFYTSTLLLSPSSVSRDENNFWWDWERYGVGIGIEGRRSLVRAILAYSPSRRPYSLAYPPPLNMLSLPLALLPLLSHRSYKLAWRFVIGPFAIVAAGLWGWGLL